ncbi:Cobalt-zinc-cadmium resistance protein CzcA [Phycisphaerae bacterium RAS1]|nr:Cobalt-zinc-cadmium resistance protein CzcA [Phycisphaerae bacterium RAS1]
MLNWIINWSLHHRLLVLGVTLGFFVGGLIAVSHLNIDAFPDTTPVQVQINTVAPSLGPEEVERQITIPVEQSISGLPSLTNVRSISKFGLSQVVVTFSDDIDIYFARRLIGERLSTVELPTGIAAPEMGPVATGLGEIFHYVVRSDSRSLTELRTIQDWTIKPVLRAVSGVAEINSWGGYEKQYQVRIDPNRLIKYGLSYDEVVEALERNNLNAGGGSIASGGAMQLVQGLGRVATLDQIGDVVIKAKDGVPIHVDDVASVEIGAEIRRGAVTFGGRGEAVLGLGFMLMGQNPHDVTTRLKAKLETVKATLPTGVHIETVYDRTELVEHVIDTVRKNLFEGGLLVIAVLFMFLGNLRAGLIVMLAIPLSMLFAFSGMVQFAIAGSLMSLGALDFGLVVDSAVIQIENVARHVAHDRTRRRFIDIVRDAVLEVRKPTMFGELIIVLVYVPILALEGIEGKLFRPMALTVIFALAGSLILSLTLMPVLASLFLPRRMEERDPFLVRLCRGLYSPVLRFVMRHNAVVLGMALCVLVVAVIVARGLGAEFIPKLSEGAIVANVIRLAGTDLDESIRYNTQMEMALLAAFPDEIRYVWSRTGTAEVATDPMGVELTDIFLSFTPRQQWKRARSQAELVELIQRELRDMPGQRVAMTQPIEMRMNEMIAGVRGDIAMKLYGDDLDVLKATGDRIGAILGSIQGAADMSTEQLTGQPVLQIKVDQEALARHGVPAKAVMDIVESLGSKPLGEVIEGQLRFPLVARLPDSYRRDSEAIRAIVLPTASGQRVPLANLAMVEEVEGPSTIMREWGQRRTTVQVNVRGRDVVSYIAEAQRRIAAEVPLPPGRYHIEWGGQFEQFERARNRLLIVVPVVLVMVFVLLYITYNRVLDAVRVFTGVPFAVVGGVMALWVRDMPFSISAGVGFIALSGVAVLGDMVLVSYVRQLLARDFPLREAVAEAAMTRLRPVLMTALVAALGFVPMALSTGVGAEVQRPLATVVIGGVISSTLLTLLVLPAIYLVFGASAAVARQEEQVEVAESTIPARSTVGEPTTAEAGPVHA